MKGFFKHWPAYVILILITLALIGLYEVIGNEAAFIVIALVILAAIVFFFRGMSQR